MKVLIAQKLSTLKSELVFKINIWDEINILNTQFYIYFSMLSKNI